MAKPETPKQPKKKAEAAREADAAISKAKNPNAPKKKMGRPSIYSTHIANVICIRISEGESLRRILMEDGMPNQSTVYEWLLKHPDFAEKYTRAREEQADTLADEIIAIADETPEMQPIYDKQGNIVDIKIDSGYVAYQKQRIEARKWTAMKLKPKKYGDKLELSGNAENPLVVEAQSEAKELFSALLQNMELSKAKR
jgi:hypothetical protein